MGRNVIVTDTYQKKYTYKLTEPVGKNFDPEFKPELTPKQMLRLGVFCGVYMSDEPTEFPRDWFTKAKLAKERGIAECDLSYFGVRASQPLSVWQKKGWIHKDDPRGWFQWYCRYYMGRRHEDDARQIKRWKAYRRHAAQVVKNCRKGDTMCRPKQRQSLLHWAYDSRKL